MTRTTSIQDRQRPAEIQQMFNSIAPTYDRLNHLLSFGLDVRWRRKAIRLFEKQRGGTFLDIATGSGDVSFELLRLQPKRIVATDFAINMLNVFRQKIQRMEYSLPIDILSSDAHALPFKDKTFDGTIVAFGIRNFADRLRALREMHRVLKPNGLSIILELSHPKTPVIAQLYSIYAKLGLPLAGKIISKHASAYTYLPDSIAAFPDEKEFLGLMNEAGFLELKAIPLTFGASTIYIGRKQSSPEVIL